MRTRDTSYAQAARIIELEKALHEARWDIVDIAPAEYGMLLHSYHSCRDKKETHRWFDAVVDQVIGLVMRTDRERAQCPLCWSNGVGPLTNGYLLPEGMRRHLIGWGQVRRCTVMTAAHRLATEYWRGEEFQEVLSRAKASSRETRQEILNHTAPYKSRLVDEIKLSKITRNRLKKDNIRTVGELINHLLQHGYNLFLTDYMLEDMKPILAEMGLAIIDSDLTLAGSESPDDVGESQRATAPPADILKFSGKPPGNGS